MSIYRAIKDSNHNLENIAVTVLSGAAAGEKALIAGGEVVWKSAENGFLAQHEGGLPKLAADASATRVDTHDGRFTVDGTEVFAELLGNEKKLIICGGGHVSLPIIRIARMAGFHVTVVEDRAEFAENARQAGADRVIEDSFKNGLAQITGDADSYFAVVTRGHKYDQECVASILNKEHAYVGMIGSRRHVALVKEYLVEQGLSKEECEELHAPIGLNIGAETPAEIAVSIIAEIIEIKNRTKRNFVYTRELLKMLVDPAHGKKVLATIIARSGSAPRSVGAKMLVCEDGVVEETIGGGSGEAEVIARALQMLQSGEAGPVIHHAEMNKGTTPEDEGMVCGGTLDVLLERV